MKNKVDVVPVSNPHQKLEGVQKVNPQEIEKMLDKAKQMQSKIPGDFVKMQFYEFKPDEFEDMEVEAEKQKKRLAKKNGKDNDSSSKVDDNQSKVEDKKISKSAVQNAKKVEKPKEQKQQVKEQAKQIPDKKNNKQAQKINKTENIQEDDAQEVEEKQKVPEEVDNEEKQENQNQEENNDQSDNDNQEEDIEGLEEIQQDLEQVQTDEEQEAIDDQENQVDDLDEQKSQEEDNNENEDQDDQDQQEQEQEQESPQKQPQIRSQMADLMEELMSEDSSQQVKSKSKQIKTQEKSQDTLKLSQKSNDSKLDEKSKKYLKVIKQYQNKIKQLNQKLEEKQLPTIQEDVNVEELSNESESQPKRHIYPAQPALNIYDEFRLQVLVEQEVKQRLNELGVDDKAHDKYQQTLEEIERNYQEKIKEMKKIHQKQLDEVRDKLLKERQQQQEKQAKQEIRSDHSSSIGSLLSQNEQENLIQQKEFRLMDSNLSLQLIDSDISSIVEEQIIAKSSKFVKQSKLTQESKIFSSKFQQQSQKFPQLSISSNISDLNSDIGGLSEVDSHLTVSDVVGAGGGLILLKRQGDSDIDSLIDSQERQQLQKNSQYQNDTFSGSIMEDLQYQDDEHSSINQIQELSQHESLVDLEEQLAQKYDLSESKKLETLKAIAKQQKQQYDRKVSDLKSQRKLQNHSQKSSVNSSINSILQGQQSYVSKVSSKISELLLENQDILDSVDSSIGGLVQSQMNSQISSSVIDSRVSYQGEKIMSDSSINSIITSKEQIKLRDKLNDVDSDVSVSYISDSSSLRLSDKSSKQSVRSFLQLKQKALQDIKMI